MSIELVRKLPYDHPYRWDGTLFGGPKLWQPDEITTAAWYDAADSSTITLNGSTVSQWDDKSGNGNHATQGAEAKQPTVESINSVPAIRFDGTDDSLIVPKPAAFGSMSIFSVWDLQTSDTDYVYGSNDAVGDTRIYMNRDRVITGRFDGGQSDSITFVAGNANARIAVHESTKLTSPHDSYLYRDGIIQGSRLGSVLNADDIIDFRLGCRAVQNSDSVFANTTIGEWIVIDNGGSQVSTELRQRIEGYLAWKWGIEADLPSGHPYETAPPTV